jgi:hypothetical protein
VLQHQHDRSACREKLRWLDGCLHVLEDDHQRGEVAVSAPVAAILRPHVAAVTAGMPIADAIELVFTEQEPYLAGQPDLVPARGDGARPDAAAVSAPKERLTPLNEAGARALTERIRNATQHVCMLLMEAHEGHAWSALGYRTWEQYVKREFGLSRSRSYELLDQGRVISELQVAAGMSEIPDISAYAAGQIKPYLGEVTRSIRDRARRRPGEHVREIIGEVVRQQRARIRALQDARRGQHLTSPSLSIRRPELGHLCTAIECLATMPDAAGTAAQIPMETARRLSLAEPALRWLSDFVEELKRRTHADALRRRAQDTDDDDYAVGA